jgi:hypothetical protein
MKLPVLRDPDSRSALTNTLMGILFMILVGWWSWLSACAISNRERIIQIEEYNKTVIASMSDVKAELCAIKRIVAETRIDQLEFYKTEYNRWAVRKGGG